MGNDKTKTPASGQNGRVWWMPSAEVALNAYMQATQRILPPHTLKRPRELKETRHATYLMVCECFKQSFLTYFTLPADDSIDTEKAEQIAALARNLGGRELGPSRALVLAEARQELTNHADEF